MSLRTALRIKKTGCADLFDILSFQNKIAIILGLEELLASLQSLQKSQFWHLWSLKISALCCFCTFR